MTAVTVTRPTVTLKALDFDLDKLASLPKRTMDLHADRMDKLAAFLEKLPPSRYDHSQYFTNSCGTVACALGHAVANKRELGFTSLPVKFNRILLEPEVTGNEHRWVDDAADSFFGPGVHNAVFDGCAYPAVGSIFNNVNPKTLTVAKRLRKVAAAFRAFADLNKQK